ncbi:MAG: glycerophosphodiester phosphodiesterase family protein [Xylanivirga thermophila]|uniref:glycerophosphodiester phosphodiesterase n=1 Tax=Xylanivirga thermophila TaxID=2496273 RepID=UPI0013ECB697|nr:glycerophosphodiester phosphodiesterase family protein [Xylanivirga thermophila]
MSIKLENGEIVRWQAHQSTCTEVPENTMAAFKYIWKIGGIPEADIRTTGDGIIICLHDKNLARTGYNIPEEYRNVPASSLTYKEVSMWDVGRKYGEDYTGERVPALEDIFKFMKDHEDRLLYLDFKDVDLEKLAMLIDLYGINNRIIFAHNNQQNCIAVKNMISNIRTMLWIGGSEESIKEKFDNALATRFEGLDQVQLHLNDKKEKTADWRYDIEASYLEYCYNITDKYGVDLEVLPYEFEKGDIQKLLNIGIRWFAVDYPKRFISYIIGANE